MKIGLMGAGAIGCYVGGRLAAAGSSVVLIGRAQWRDDVAAHGLHITDYRGYEANVAASALAVSADAAALRDCDLVAVAVKSNDTAATAQILARELAPKQVVVSLQNGVHNAEILRQALPRHTVLAGMVQFNVVRPDVTSYHCTTNGRIVVEDAAAAPGFVDLLRSAGIEADASGAVVAILWGKLLFNLSNAVNALSGLPLRTMLAQRPYRLIMAAAVEEAVRSLDAAKIAAILNVPIPAAWLPGVLRLPTPLFRLAAKSMLAVDPKARTSMADDLARGRKTEVDFLNGEIVELAARHKIAAPTNAALVALVHAAETAGQGSPNLGAAALSAAIKGTK